MNAINPYQQFFARPACALQRKYEMFRARFVDQRSVADIARQFHYTTDSVYTMLHQFKTEIDQGRPPAFFMETRTGPKSARKKEDIKEHVLRLRARGYASTDIHKALRAAGYSLSLSLVDHILREQGLGQMAKRTRSQRIAITNEIARRQVPGLDIPLPAPRLQPEVADATKVWAQTNPPILTQHAGAFLFLPFLVHIGWPQIIEKAGWPGSRMIPAVSHALNALLLKLRSRERKSHVNEMECDRAAGLFMGLNVPPKKQATTDYSYRLSQRQHDVFLQEWTRALYPELCPQGATEFALDAHAIAYRGRDDLLETHYVPTRGKKAPAIISFFGRAVNRPFLCYGNADLRKNQLADLPLAFADYWKQITGQDPSWLYFDSRTTTYEGLKKLDERGINFITVRRRGTSMIQKAEQARRDEWKATTIPTERYPHTRIHYLDQNIRVAGYPEPIRQVVQRRATDATSFFLTNNMTVPARNILERYHQRNYIENEIGVNVDFFHMDCLSSEVALNVSFDVLMTLAAHGCYRWLAQSLKGCEKMEPKQLHRMIISTPGMVQVDDARITVCLERRSHNPILRQALGDKEPVKIPWLGNKPLVFAFK